MKSELAILKSQADILEAQLTSILKRLIPGVIITRAIVREYMKGLQRVQEEFRFDTIALKDRLELIRDNALQEVKGMAEATKDRLRGELVRGYMDDTPSSVLKEKIEKAMDVTKARAKMIARTETARAHNTGALDAAKQSGLNLRKWLLITYDNRTSDVSKAMGRKYGKEQQAIALEEEFHVKVGGKEYRGQQPPFMPNDRDAIMFTEIE